jgi:hypothetical protein
MSGDVASLEAARSYLRSGGSASVYEHLQTVLLRIVKEKPAEPLKQFEALSVQIKQERMREKARDNVGASPAAASLRGVLGIDVPSAPLVTTSNAEAALAAYLQKTQDLIKKPKKFNEDGEEEEEEEPEPNAAAPDLQHEAFLLQQAGQRHKHEMMDARTRK